MKRIIKIVVPVVLVCVLVFSGWKWYSSNKAAEESAAAYAALESRMVRVVDSQGRNEESSVENAAKGQWEETTEEERLYPLLDIDMDALYEINRDFCGWLYFPALDISYPVVQSTDNDYYLRRSFEGESLTAGTLFMDWAAVNDWSDRNTFIFGHNMNNGSMFGRFREMVDDPSICASDPYFYIYTPTEVYTYEIFSYYIVKADSDRYMTFTTDMTYDYYVQWALDNSLYQPEEELDFSERGNIVSLSTCSGVHGSGKRMLVHGVRIRTEAYDPEEWEK